MVSVMPLQSLAFQDLTASRSGGTQGPERSLEVMSRRQGVFGGGFFLAWHFALSS